jgi:hypothetical protein
LCHSQEGQELHLTRDHGGGEEGWRFFRDDFRRAQSYGPGPGLCIILYTHERTERIVAVAISDVGGSSRLYVSGSRERTLRGPLELYLVGARMRLLVDDRAAYHGPLGPRPLCATALSCTAQPVLCGRVREQGAQGTVRQGTPATSSPVLDLHMVEVDGRRGASGVEPFRPSMALPSACRSDRAGQERRTNVGS